MPKPMKSPRQSSQGGIAYFTAERVLVDGFFEDRPIDKGNGDPTRMRFYFQRSSHKEPEHYVEVWLDTDTGSINVRSADQILIAPLVSNGVQVMVVRS
jgi:hypothetical protein